MTELKSSTSEETTLAAKGYRLLKYLGEGAYAKVVFSHDYKLSILYISEHYCFFVKFNLTSIYFASRLHSIYFEVD